MGIKAYQIWLGGQAVDESFYGDVVSLTVEESTSAAGSFTLRLASRLLDDGSWGYLDHRKLTLFTEVTIQIGFMSAGGLVGAIESLIGGSSGDTNLHTVFKGYITGIPLSDGRRPARQFRRNQRYGRFDPDEPGRKDRQLAEPVRQRHCAPDCRRLPDSYKRPMIPLRNTRKRTTRWRSALPTFNSCATRAPQRSGVLLRVGRPRKGDRIFPRAAVGWHAAGGPRRSFQP